MANRISLDEFNFNVTEFRTLMGAQSFWTGPQSTRDAAVKGLGFCYLWVDSSAIEKAAVTFDSTIQEYEMRSTYNCTIPRPQN